MEKSILEFGAYVLTAKEEAVVIDSFENITFNLI